MKLIKTVISASALAVTLSAAAGCSRSTTQAQATGDRKTKVEKTTSTPKENIRQVSIIVKDVDRDEHKVTFEARVSPEANILYNGQPIALDSLQKGDSLRVAFDPTTGEVVKAEVVRKGRK
jgi:hypothetical protein